MRRIRTEHFQSLKHHLEVLLRHNVVLKERLKRSSKPSKPTTTSSDDNYKHSNEICNKKSQTDEEQNVFISQKNEVNMNEEKLENSALSNSEVANCESENMGTLLNGINSKQQQAEACNLIQDIEVRIHLSKRTKLTFFRVKVT